MLDASRCLRRVNADISSQSIITFDVLVTLHFLSKPILFPSPFPSEHD